MSETLQRDPVRTRRQLLRAAAAVFAREGATASLDSIARAAGVSKGGLLHHFPSKAALLVGLVDDWLTAFDAAVERHLDPADTRPGRVCRAYINANFDPELDDHGPRSAAVISALMATPEVLHRAHDHDRRWRDALADDGLNPQRVLLIAGLVDTVSLDEVFGSLVPGLRRSADDRHELRTLLLALTEQTGQLVAVPDTP